MDQGKFPEGLMQDTPRMMLLPPERLAAQPESLTEKQIIDRSLEENRFWLRIMKEHALFLGEGMSRKNRDLILQLNRFYRYFEDMEKRAHQTPENIRAVKQLNSDSIELVYSFRNFKRNLLILIINCQVSGFNFPLLVDHIAREAEYFISTLRRLNEGIMEPLQDSIITENVFWLRIMMEHSRFIASLLDQSERKLVTTAMDFANNFETLLGQARDVESMLLNKKPTYPIIGKMNQDSKTATEELRDFKKAALDLIRACKIKSVISPLLADHVLREAEHFLNLINQLDERLRVKEREMNPR